MHPIAFRPVGGYRPKRTMPWARRAGGISCSIEHMVADGEFVEDERKPRIAIGVFDDVAKLRRAIDAFRALGLGAGQVTLLADSGILFGQLEAGLASDDGNGSSERPRFFIRGTAPNVGPADTGTSPFQGAPFTADQVLHFENWIAPAMTDELNIQLAQGACILFAPVVTAHQERKMSEILLNHSVGSVQLHDLHDTRTSM